MKKWLLCAILLLSAGWMFAEIGWCGNIWPNSGSTQYNDNGVDVYFQIWKDGATNSSGQGADISAKLFYKESSQGSYSYVNMSYLGDVGNNDEYKGTIPVHILNMGSTVNYYCVAYDATDASSKTGNDQNGTPLNESSPGSLNISAGATANGWFEDFLTISANGSSANYWIGSDPGSGTQYQGFDLGAVTSLSITACSMKYWSNTLDRTGGSYFWQIKDESGNVINEETDPYDVNEVIWSQADLDGNIYQGTSSSVQNIITGLEDATTYQLHIWAKSWDGGGGQGDSWLSNNSANYVATFTTPDGQVPITLASFRAEAVQGVVNVTWVTESETENDHFVLRRNGEILTTIGGAGTTTEPHTYAFVDRHVEAGRVYSYALSDVSYGGVEMTHEPVIVEIPTGAAAECFALEAAYPNPFNPQTTISYSLGKGSQIDLAIYNTNGIRVATLFSGEREAGYYESNWYAGNMPSGIYLIRMTAEGQILTQKVVLMK
ncbi:MAG: T9SS type A sorting domain-containing protein [Dehalococcoidales bacterium]|nr:T9SS type A sorting domain-containing protein [Dehalococcoidales bacterium]